MNHQMKKSSVLIFSSIGTMLELYDYVLFAVMIPFFAHHFFTFASKEQMLTLGYILFACSFLFSALGSLIWGFVGDKYGRLKCMQYSIFIMSIPSICIALLPGYKSIGLLAPGLLLFLRIFQAVSASGEIQTAKIFAMEYFGKHKYGFASGYVSAAASFGVMLAMLMGYLCSLYIKEYPQVWRLPFLAGGLLAIVGGLIRRFLNDVKSVKLSSNAKFLEIITIIKDHPRATVLAISLGGAIGVYSYLMHAFINPFLTSLGVAKEYTYIASIYSNISCIIGSFAGGMFIDKLKDIDKAQIISLITSIMAILVSYLLMISGTDKWIAIGYIIAGFFLGSQAVIATVKINTSFKDAIRCRGALLCYALGIAIFGGNTPWILSCLARFSSMYPLYMISLVLLGILIITVTTKEGSYE